ncbi:hypothetical protein DPMN_119245 [Dreissena polymorpha]|uniref:Uncharacterized protein n=1 Tax=Dreissena polymorpha TaxID=45954 RepID=A0A9D4GIG4_DREPO|nr:hypothetical protein DPMN_119245 [Dreissena polymorpha]
MNADRLKHLQKSTLRQCIQPRDSSPLNHSFWMMNTTHIGIMTVNERHTLSCGDISLGVDFESVEENILLDTERQTKTRTWGNPRNTR